MHVQMEYVHMQGNLCVGVNMASYSQVRLDQCVAFKVDSGLANFAATLHGGAGWYATLLLVLPPREKEKLAGDDGCPYVMASLSRANPSTFKSAVFAVCSISLGSYLTSFMASSAFSMWLLLLPHPSHGQQRLQHVATVANMLRTCSQDIKAARWSPWLLGQQACTRQCASHDQASVSTCLCITVKYCKIYKFMCRQLCWDMLVQVYNPCLKFQKDHQFVFSVYLLSCRSGGQLW
jgi:hypothetical protein